MPKDDHLEEVTIGGHRFTVVPMPIWDDKSAPETPEPKVSVKLIDFRDMADKMRKREAATPKRYPIGLKYMRWKGIGEPDGSPLGHKVVCEIVRVSYLNDTLGWIYDAKASEPVEHMDNNWVTSFSTETFISEHALDKMNLVDGIYQ